MSETKTHSGGCHCGRVRFQVAVDLDQTLATCNCSICSKTGAIMAFVPAEAFELEAGAAELADYQFGKKHVHHLFCRVCGIRAFAHGENKDGERMYMVNVRCLDDVDASSLETKEFDGKSL